MKSKLLSAPILGTIAKKIPGKTAKKSVGVAAALSILPAWSWVVAGIGFVIALKMRRPKNGSRGD